MEKVLLDFGTHPVRPDYRHEQLNWASESRLIMIRMSKDSNSHGIGW